MSTAHQRERAGEHVQLVERGEAGWEEIESRNVCRRQDLFVASGLTARVRSLKRPYHVSRLSTTLPFQMRCHLADMRQLDEYQGLKPADEGYCECSPSHLQGEEIASPIPAGKGIAGEQTGRPGMLSRATMLCANLFQHREVDKEIAALAQGR